MNARALVPVLAACAACGTPPWTEADTADAGEPAPDPRGVAEVVSFTPGENAGHGQDRMPGIVQGGPQGLGEFQGSTDVLSLGTGGVITVRMGMDILDGEGPDFVVFENAFRVNGTQLRFQEPAQVEVSMDGATFTAFPCNAVESPYAGCAGITPVLSSNGNPDPADQPGAGGDAFDLADIGIARARFVRITDRSRPAAAPTAGFDLDAVVVRNGDGWVNAP